MRCRKCKKEVPDRMFGYCKECAESLGADTHKCECVPFDNDRTCVICGKDMTAKIPHKCPECPADNMEAMLDNTNTCKVCGTKVFEESAIFVESKNGKILKEFTEYCEANKDQRFWQALSNFCDGDFVVRAKDIDWEKMSLKEWRDTYYFEKKSS